MVSGGGFRLVSQHDIYNKRVKSILSNLRVDCITNETIILINGVVNETVDSEMQIAAFVRLLPYFKSWNHMINAVSDIRYYTNGVWDKQLITGIDNIQHLYNVTPFQNSHSVRGILSQSKHEHIKLISNT